MLRDGWAGRVICPSRGPPSSQAMASTTQEPEIRTAQWWGKPLADRLVSEVRERWESQARPSEDPPCLASVGLGEGSPFHVYQRQQARVAQRAGIRFRGEILPRDVSPEGLRARVEELAKDASIHGILLEHPLPPAHDFARIVSGINPWKDVDGVGPTNVGNLATGRPVQVPAVALAARALLQHYGEPTAGRHVVVVGRSETVGIPLALLFLLRGERGDATVTVVHSRTVDLAEHLRRAEILIPCAGRPGLVSRRNTSRGAVVVDVGLATAPGPDPSAPPRVAGDADARSLEGWARAYTPVPGGVGPVTVAEIMASTVRSWEAARTGGDRT